MDNSGFSLIGQPDRPYRVLVVEDDEMHLSMHVETLQSLPCQVTTTTSGYDALSLVEQDNFDKVIEVIKDKIKRGWRDPEIGKMFIDMLMRDPSGLDAD